ncbi:multisubunit sodium/proton antiporter, MrpD subunit [Natronoarchaeum philippinense]|uniref:Multisubunit sodium/proton antiporter, MrpD subunit n=1 Tax=Natronoarchaeum philippinense TaxID=558529 RepID=A0A285N120_NATPI|nr:proton-conducting transporter membrane subunit [Natronoarchaeum philippinense]SNZ02623.1 multisubunit sodium/proton antiporter, MrpD subunit [Natronoarchaeum philippinense]
MTDASIAVVGLIVLPLVAAAVALLAGVVRDRTGWAIAVASLLGEAALVAWLATAVYGGQGELVHVLGGYGRPGPEGLAVGIELVADQLSALIAVLIVVVSLGVLAVARSAGPRGNAFFSAFLLLNGGLMGVVLTGDVFNLFVFLEIVGLATYALVASDRRPDAAVATLKYLIVGTTGASMYLLGVAYLFMATGVLNMADLSAVLAGQAGLGGEVLYTDTLVLAGFAFVTVGLFVKAAIFPLHVWQPDAYAAAPDTVTAYISALVSTAGAYAFARIALDVFTPAFFEAVPAAAWAIVTLASISVVAGSALAVTQTRVKRVFAYSSVSQFGLIVAAVGVAVHPAASPAAIEYAVLGAAIHLIGHGVIKGGLFVAAAGLARTADARTLDEYAGLGREAPLQSGALAVLALSLVGVPPTVGFLGKFYIALGAVEAGIWPVAAVILLSTVLTLAYAARFLERLYFTPRSAAPSTGAVAADGGSDGSSPAAQSKRDADLPGASLGLLAALVGAVILAVALGFAGFEFADAMAPFVSEVVQ